MPSEPSDRWALITGASSGIGKAFAHVLARRGWNLVLTARREERLRKIAEQFHPGTTVVIRADLLIPGEARRLWARATAGRRVDLLINNAGFGLRGRFEELPLDRQMEMIQLNCSTVTELAHYALRSMRAGGTGAIINVASNAAFQPVARMATYAATKAFVLSLSQALSEENHPHNIRILALCPGPIPTEFQQVAAMGLPTGVPQEPADDEVVQVVNAALEALDNGKSYVIPGALNHLRATVARLPFYPSMRRLARIVLRRKRESR